MIKPLENYLVLEEKINTQLESGIVLSGTENIDKPNIATIIVVGPSVTKVKIGDEVIFKYHLFDEITLDKKKYLIGKDEGIVALC